MTTITLEAATQMIAATTAYGVEHGMKPLSMIVLDAGGHPIAFARANDTSPARYAIAHGKAYGAVMMGMSGTTLNAMAKERPEFLNALNTALGGTVVPVQGGVLVKSADGKVIGSVGVTGDTSENDAAAGQVGIEAAGFTAES
ncbi:MULTISPECIES: GlcG/HbpS family heme-binding protein [Pacificibacter]|uniref:GlcG/HbpS family heme-binding protein n=1 Tax=Pacificibacter TaxID=1042323 RepID=UPI001C0988B9|nr:MULTISPECIES: heme-binding protein [Pacificibacter]MBU2935773.1 heme-binding protein [Pacificibacter marinus]MDO6614269.1 heme-binding protein [Pacificibacter sp. 1_MG-2023]